MSTQISRSTSQVEFVLSTIFQQRPVDMSQSIANVIAPPTKAKKIAGKYFKSKSKHLRILTNYGLRLPGSKLQRITNDFEEANYDCKSYGAEDRLSEEQLRKADDSIDLITSTILGVQNGLFINREKHVVDTVINTTNFNTAGMYDALTGAERWDTDTGQPLLNISTGVNAIIEAVGVAPNLALCNMKVWKALANNGDTLERLGKFGITVLTQEKFKEMININDNPIFTKMHVSSLTHNTSKETTTDTIANESFGYIMPNGFLLARIEEYSVNDKGTVNFASTIVPDDSMMEAGVQIQSYYDDSTDEIVYKAFEYRDPVVTNIRAAYYIDTPIS